MRAVAAVLSIGLVLAACGTGRQDDDLPVAEASPVDVDPTPTAVPTPTEPSPTVAVSQSPTPGPSPSPSPASTPEPPPAAAPGFAAVPADSVELPQELFPFALSRDGTRLYVDGPHPDGVGCEESQPYALQLYDLATGDLTLELDPTLGLFGPFRGPGDRALLVLGCEGFLGRVMVGDEQPDGRITALQDVAIPTGGGLSGDATAVGWTPDGELVWVVIGGGSTLVTTDLAGNETQARVTLDREHYDLAATRSEVWTVDYRGIDVVVLGLRSGDVLAGYEDLVAAPDLDAVLALGDAGVRLLRGDGSQEVWVSDPVGDDVVWRGGTLAVDDLAYVIEDRSQPPDFAGDRRLHAIGPDGIVETVDVGTDSVPGPLLSADGDRLVYVVRDDVAGSSRVVVRDRV